MRCFLYFIVKQEQVLTFLLLVCRLSLTITEILIYPRTSNIILWQSNCPSIAIRELRHPTLGQQFALMFSNGRWTMADIWPKNVPNIEILSCSFHTSNICLTDCSGLWQAIYCLQTVTSHGITSENLRKLHWQHDTSSRNTTTDNQVIWLHIPLKINHC